MKWGAKPLKQNPAAGLRTFQRRADDWSWVYIVCRSLKVTKTLPVGPFALYIYT